MNLHVKADVSALLVGAEISKAAPEPVDKCEGLICSHTLQLYAKSQLEASARKGRPLGLNPSLGPVMSVTFIMYWDLASDDKKIVGALEGALGKMLRPGVNPSTLPI